MIEEADAVIVGIGAGMSAADGFTYIGERFTKNFEDFIEKYGWLDMLQASLQNSQLGKNTGLFKVDLSS